MNWRDDSLKRQTRFETLNLVNPKQYREMQISQIRDEKVDIKTHNDEIYNIMKAHLKNVYSCSTCL